METMEEKSERVKAIDSLVEVYIKKGVLSNALKAAKLGASPQKIDSLVEVYIKKGWFSDAQEAAKLGRRKLSTQEIDSLVEVVR